jgi:serine/threonine-protein kinase
MGLERPAIAGNLHEGDVLGGKYRVERLLGAGGMGVVVCVQRLSDGQRVALKLLQPWRHGDEDFDERATRLVREAKATAALHDEHIVRMFEAATFEDGSRYLEMELLEGVDLARVVRERGPLPVGEAVDYMLQICQGIAEAHARGIIHRDLKPQNVFLAQRSGAPPLIKVLDFGISKLTGSAGGSTSLTATGSTLGSPHYISFEQFRDPSRVDHRTDLWSLGMILHFLLTGRTAYEADTLASLLFKLSVEAPKPLRHHRPDAPEAVEAVILRCLEKDPARRFPDVLAMAEALSAYAPPSSRGALDRMRRYLGASRLQTSPELSPLASTLVLPPASASLAGAPPSADTTQGVVRPSVSPSSAGRRRAWPLIAAGVAVAATAALGWFAFGRSRSAPRVEATEAPSAAPAVLTTAVPTAPAPAPAPATVTITLSLRPPNATLELDGAPVKTPLHLPMDERTHKLVIRAPGYEPMTREIGARSDAYLDLSLQKTPAAPAVTPRPTDKKRNRGPLEQDL